MDYGLKASSCHPLKIRKLGMRHFTDIQSAQGSGWVYFQ